MMSTGKVKVWDLGIRLFHWLLVLFFFAAYVTGDDSLVHIYAGYVIAALLAFRLVWGFIGPVHARFSDFVCGPRAVGQYLRSIVAGQPKHYLGHNPLGGWMALALLVSVAGVTWTGLETYGAEGHGPLAEGRPIVTAVAYANGDNGREEEDEHEEDEFWEELHEVTANLTLLLVFFHVFGVLIASVLHRENLVKAMLTGYKE